MAVLEANRVADSGGATLTVPPGTLIFHCANSAPSGFLKANGASLSTTTYAALFSAIGYTFGGSGGSFSVPDLRGEFARGWDDGRGVDSGRAFGSAQTSQNLSHTHGVSPSGSDNNCSGGSGAGRGWGANGGYSGQTILPTDSSGGTEARPRNIALLACIKY
jgi:phage-related tail fiber protein